MLTSHLRQSWPFFQGGPRASVSLTQKQASGECAPGTALRADGAAVNHTRGLQALIKTEGSVSAAGGRASQLGEPWEVS